MRWISVLGLLTLVACGEAALEAGTQGMVGPAYPGSEVLREVDSSTAEPYEPPQGDNSCPTRFTAYGVDEEPEKVTTFYEGQGVVLLGQGGRFDRGYRWIGERPGDETNWLRVDIASGDISGTPEWATYYEVHAPACGSDAEASPVPAQASRAP